MAVARRDPRENVRQLLRDRAGIKLDLGCGATKQQGWVGLDRRAVKGVDLVHDIETLPWPLPDDCAVTVLCSQLLQYVDPRRFFDVMGEVHRVCRHDAQVQVSVPYAGSEGAFQDPTSLHSGYTPGTWYYLDPRPVLGRPNALYAVHQPPPFFVERLEWDVVTNVEVLLRVVKDRAVLRAALRVPPKLRVAHKGEAR